MKTIYKYQLTPTMERIFLSVPGGMKFLHAGEQDGALTVWSIVNTESPSQDVWIRVYGTGWPIESPWTLTHIGTVQMTDGLVWHVFEEKPTT